MLIGRRGTGARFMPGRYVFPGGFTVASGATLNVGAGTLRLFFRANESAVYTSAVYPASTTIDA